MIKRKVIGVIGTVCMLQALAAGCAFDVSDTAGTPGEDVVRQETEVAPSEDGAGQSNEQSAGNWHVLDSDTAAAVDADFIGKVWKIDGDSFLIAETKVKILDDGSVARSSPSSNANILDSQLIQVICDEETYFYLRTVQENGVGEIEKQRRMECFNPYVFLIAQETEITL